MKFGDKATLKITTVDKKGRGCGDVTVGGGNIRRACVPFAGPGETVEGTMVARRQGVLRFQLDRIVEASPNRVTPRCPYAGKCGGCAWQQFDYAHQLELKRDLVNRAFASGGLHERIDAVAPAPSLYYYRNRMDYCVGPQGQLGLKEPGRWNAYLDLETCYLLSPEAVEAMRIFREHMKTFGLVPWDVVRHEGYARYLVIREGKNTGQRMITVVTSEGELPGRDALVAALSPLATTLYHGVNPTITDLSTASSLTLLHGAPHLEETVHDRRFLIHPNSFFQTNTAMAAALVDAVRAALAPSKPKTLLDLYCGVGFFGICLADAADRIVGVEIDAEAIALARENAKLNGAANTEYFADKAESLVWEREQPDAVIVDPPRSGLHPRVSKTLLEKMPPRIAYVSCNYESFVRDFALLRAKYRIASLQAFDLFPHSPHVELVALLEAA